MHYWAVIKVVVISITLSLFVACGGGGSDGGGGGTDTYSIGGTITGVTGAIVLQNNSGNDLTLNSEGAFAFTTKLANGSDYSVTVLTHPDGQSCAVTNGSGKVSGSDISSVLVTCLSAIAPSAPTVSVSYDTKTVRLSWDSVANANYYRIAKNPDGVSGYSQIGSDQTSTVYSDVLALHLSDWLNLSYIVSACNDVGCTESSPITSLSLLQAIGYFKASNTDAENQYAGRFGASVALSGDGLTMAVGAIWEDSYATGINGDQTGEQPAAENGAVYVFRRNSDTGIWSQEAYIKALNTGYGDQFGFNLAISSEGDTLAVGTYWEDSNAKGINGNDSDNSATESGAAYIFVREEGSWSQQAYIKASNTDENDRFGQQLALSADGNTMAVGAELEDSNSTEINGNEMDNSSNDRGAVYVFTRDNVTWSQQAYIKPSQSEDSHFGGSLALSDDGLTLAVSSNNSEEGGLVSIFTFDVTWSEQQRLTGASFAGHLVSLGVNFCYSGLGSPLALSADGNTLAAGDCFDRSNATGIDGDSSDTSLLNAGAVWVFSRSETSWSKQAYIKASNTNENDQFGSSVTLSDDGNTLAIGAINEQSSAIGVDGEEEDNSVQNGAGAVYLFKRDSSTWMKNAYIKPTNTHPSDPLLFGLSLGLSSSGETLAVGASTESSSSTGINGDQTADSRGSSSGAVYLY